MNTINQACILSAHRMRWLVLGLIFGAGAAFGAILGPTVRRRLAAAAAVAAVATSSLLIAQPAAADTTYPVNVTFDNVKFSMVLDGNCLWTTTCGDLEVYGTVGAYTTAGASSAGGSPYRLFGKWGEDPCLVYWNADNGTSCTKRVYAQTYNFKDVFLCSGSQYQTCSTGYSKSNNVINLQVHPGEQFKVTVWMQDYDDTSANDDACRTSHWFGPYTAEQLQAKTYITDAKNTVLMMPYNGSGECWIGYHLS
jgi:hypothetical protein